MNMGIEEEKSGEKIVEYLKEEIKRYKKRDNKTLSEEKEFVGQILKYTIHPNPSIRYFSIILLKKSAFTRYEEIYEKLLSRAHEWIIDDDGNVRYAAELLIKHAADYIAALLISEGFIRSFPLFPMRNVDLKRFDIAYADLFERLYQLKKKEQDLKKAKSLVKCLKYRMDEVYRIANRNNNTELIKAVNEVSDY